MAPTYVLAPNLTYHPNTSICMGDIIEYPDDPTKPLSSVADSESKEITSHFDYDNELSGQTVLSLRGSIWANFLQKASSKIGGGTSDELLARYTIRRLETIYFTKQPTDEEAADRVEDRKVKAAVNAGLLAKKPVFMITGLKVARGFQLSRSVISSADASAELKAHIMPHAEAGVDADYSRQMKAEQKYRTPQDIIFAYQLHIITHKRRGFSLAQTNVDISVYGAPAAFLSEGGKGGEEEVVGIEAATESAIREFDKELEMEVGNGKDCEQECICISFK